MTVAANSISTNFLNALIIIGILLVLGTFIVTYVFLKKAREAKSRHNEATPEIISYYTGGGKYDDITERRSKPKPAKNATAPISFTHTMQKHALAETQ